MGMATDTDGLTSSCTVYYTHLPEAPTLEAAFQGTTDYETIKITPDRMREMRRRLNTGDKEQVDMVLTGCPHLSVDEMCIRDRPYRS